MGETQSSNKESFIDKTVETFQSFEYYDSIMKFFDIAILSISIILLVVSLSILARYIARYLHHMARMKRIGGMVWNEIIYEGNTNADEKYTAGDQMESMARIMPTLSDSVFGIRFSRPVTSFLIRKDEEGDTRLYVGMDRKHYDESTVSSWASKANCGAEEVDFDEIGFIPKAPAVLTKNGYKYANITKTPRPGSAGSVITNVQSSMEGGSTVVVSVEPMLPFESDLMANHVNSHSVKTRGEKSVLDSGARQMSIMNGYSPSRGVVMGFSDTGSRRVSEGILRSAQSGMSYLGVNTSVTSPAAMHARFGLIALIPTAILAVFAFFGFGSWYVAGALIVATLLALLRSPWLSDYWVGKASTYGALPIPPFWRWSLRRLIVQRWVGFSKLDIDTSDGSVKYIAEPSCREVIPFYQTSLMEFASMPLSGINASEISASAFPQVSLSKNAEGDMEPYVRDGDAIYLGLSAKTNAPVFRLTNDINYGLAIAGAPGSGKTNLLQSDFVGMCRLSRKTTGRAGGMTINPIWFETKADNISSLLSMTKRFNPQFVRLHDQNSPERLALEGGRITDEGVSLKDIESNVNALVSGLVSVFGDSLGPRSRMAARNAIVTAMLLKESELKALGIHSRIANPSRPNVMELTNILIGGEPSINIVGALKKMHKAIESLLLDENKSKERAMVAKHNGTEELDRFKFLSVAMAGLINLHDTRDALSPMINKIDQLIGSKGLFDTTTEDGVARKEYSLKRLYTNGGPFIVDMTNTGSAISVEQTELFTMLVHSMMWDSIQLNCGGWGAQGKFIPIYADEVTNFTGRSSDNDNRDCVKTISEVRDKGRSYGVSHNIGFQSYGQLPRDAENVIRGFDSAIYLQMKVPDDLNKIMEQIGSGTKFSPDVIRMFSQGVGIASLSIGRKQRNIFTIKTPWSVAWNDALIAHNENLTDAIDDIYDEEVEFMKRERRKKVDKDPEPQPMVTNNTPYVDDSYDDADQAYMPYHHDDNDDDGDTLSWS